MSTFPSTPAPHPAAGSALLRPLWNPSLPNLGHLASLSLLLLLPAALVIVGLYWLHRKFRDHLFPHLAAQQSPPMPLVSVQEMLLRLKRQEEELTRLRRDAEQHENDTLQVSRQVLSHLPSGVIFLDRWGRVQDANPAARTALGYASPRGLLPHELFRDAILQEEDGTPIGPAADLFREGLVADRSLQRKNMDYLTPAGERRLLGVTFFPLRADNQSNGLICLLTDLTAIRALESELERRRNLSSLGEMSAGIAHEFKNSLATISGYAQMLYRSLPEQPPAPRQHVTRILDQVHNLSTVATEFLTFARPLDLVTAEVNLNQLLRECLDSVRMQDFAGIKFIIEDDFPDVPGDPVLLSNVFVNLVRNSCQAIAEHQSGNRVEIRLETFADWRVRVSVRDNGPGIPRDLHDKIFIPFFTTKANGTGLGLAMAHKIIAAHQGSIQLAESRPGSTIFLVSLPLDLPLAPRPEISENYVPDPNKSRLTPPTVPL